MALSGTHCAVLLLTCLVTGLDVAADDSTNTHQQWGTVAGHLIFDGMAPEPPKLDITRDEDFCGPFDLRDESLLVDPKTKGIRYVAVWIDSREPVPIHPDLKAFPKDPLVLDNRDCRFQPRMLTLRPSQEIQISNSDPLAHNAAVYVRRNQPFSIVISQNEPLVRSFRRPESLPVRVECSIHAWMRAYMLICDHPYAAVSDKNGRFELDKLPAGEWSLHFWHERPGHLRTVTVGGTEQTLERGLLKITVPPDGELDLGGILVECSQFSDDQ
jgi:hypothetical protein